MLINRSFYRNCKIFPAQLCPAVNYRSRKIARKALNASDPLCVNTSAFAENLYVLIRTLRGVLFARETLARETITREKHMIKPISDIQSVVSAAFDFSWCVTFPLATGLLEESTIKRTHARMHANCQRTKRGGFSRSIPFPFHCCTTFPSTKRIYLCIAQPLINVPHSTPISDMNDIAFALHSEACACHAQSKEFCALVPIATRNDEFTSEESRLRLAS